MLRKISVILAICLSMAMPVFAEGQEVIDSFIEFTSVIVAPIQKTYQGAHYTINPAYRDIKAGRNQTMYYKTVNTNFNYKYDIQKTESVLSPYLAFIDMYSDKQVYKQYLAPQTAKDSTNDLVRTIKNYKAIRFYYRYINEAWVLVEQENLNQNVLGNAKQAVSSGYGLGVVELDLMRCEDKEHQ